MVNDINDINLFFRQNGPHATAAISKVDPPRMESSSKRRRVEDQNTDQTDDVNIVKKYQYVLTKKRVRTFANHTGVETTYNINIDGLKNKYVKDSLDVIGTVFEEVLLELKQGDKSLFAKVVIVSPTLDKPIVVTGRDIKDLTSDAITDKVCSVVQSQQQLSFEDLEIMVGVLDKGSGTGLGGERLYPVTFGSGKSNVSNFKLKKSTVKINNDDKFCLMRSIAVGWAKNNKCTNEEWESTKKLYPTLNAVEIALISGKCNTALYKHVCSSNRNEQIKLAEGLMTRAGFAKNVILSFSDLSVIEQNLDHQIVVYCGGFNNKPIYRGSKHRRDQIFLFMTKCNDSRSHFDAIVNIRKFHPYFNDYCRLCLKPYKTGKHYCAIKCFVCGSECPPEDAPITCNDCNIVARNQTCYENHKLSPVEKSGSFLSGCQSQSFSKCQKYWNCLKCGAHLERSKRSPEMHLCGERFCDQCDSYVTEKPHLCYQRVKNPTEFQKSQKLIFLDMETCTSHRIECERGYQSGSSLTETACNNCKKATCGSYRHTPVLLVLQIACDHCKDPDTIFDQNGKQFKSNNILKESYCKFCCNRCEKCHKKTNSSPCFSNDLCGKNQMVFYGLDCVQQFCYWIFREQHCNSILFAHNGSGFDFHFILQECLSKALKPDKVIFCGSKLQYVSFRQGFNIQFIDSFKYLNMALRKLPKSLGLPDMCKKGDFPYKFVRHDNLDYVGVFPALSFYAIDKMNEKELSEFKIWHENKVKNNESFDMMLEMINYCISDVNVLRCAVLKYQKIICDYTACYNDKGQIVSPGLDVFVKAHTIASASMNIYKAKCYTEKWKVTLSNGEHVWANLNDGVLKIFYHNSWFTEEQLKSEMALVILHKHFHSSPSAYIGNDTYILKDTFSEISIKWLEYLQKSKGIFIQHALNAGEKRLFLNSRYYPVDGWAEPTSAHPKGTVFLFNGCFYHGHHCTFPNKRDHSRNGRESPEKMYKRTINIMNMFKDVGYNLEYIWECEFMKSIEKNKELKEFIDDCKITPRLNMRDSMYGGRTECFRMYHNSNDFSKKDDGTFKYFCNYFDFTSLYPAVLSKKKYGLGHPKIMRNVDPITLPDLFGLLYVTILPPKHLLYPVLPMKINGKLMFTLCYKCALDQNQNACMHSDKERALISTWCSPEINKAVESGYTLLKIHEVWHFDKVSEPKDDSLGFSKYVGMFLKMKQTASGFPVDVVTENEKVNYVQEYFQNEGIALELEKIAPNPGMRCTAKIHLNSLYGKLGQSTSHAQHEYFHSDNLDDMYDLITDPNVEISDFHILNSDIILLHYRMKKELERESSFINPIMGAFVTTYARLELLSLLEQLGNRCVYADTDSVIFVSGEDLADPPLGNYLGELTSEIPHGTIITEFVTIAPKSYAIKICEASTPHKEVQVNIRCKGFTLTGRAKDLVNIETMKNILFKNVPLKTPAFCIKTMPKSGFVYNQTSDKVLKFTFDKRIVQKDFTTLPYGYK